MARREAEAQPRPAFLFATCQVGAERALKAEVGRRWSNFAFAYSRPGFLTFKLPSEHALADDFDLQAVFARAHGFSLDNVSSADAAERAAALWRLAEGRPLEALHVWQRDAAPVGYRGFEPQVTAAARDAETAIRAAMPAGAALSRRTEPGQLVLDCVLVEPEQWWVGYHRARRGPSCDPGGLCEIVSPPDAVSRAYLKMEEALRWSELPIEPGDEFVEIGCAGRGEPGAVGPRFTRGGHRPRAGRSARAGEPQLHAHPQARRRLAAARVPPRRLAGRRYERRPVVYARHGRSHRHAPDGERPRAAADAEIARLEFGQRAAGVPRARPRLGIRPRGGAATRTQPPGGVRHGAAEAASAA